MEHLDCLNPGQSLVVATKLFDAMGPVQFIQEVPNKFFTSLLVDDFAELASVVMEGGLHQELEENFWRATFTGTNENIWLAGLLNESPKRLGICGRLLIRTNFIAQLPQAIVYWAAVATF